MDLKRLPQWNVMLGAVGLLTFFATCFCGNGGWLLFIAGCVWIIASEYAWQFFKNQSPSPYLWMLLSPLLLWHYSSVADFRIRLACFFMLVYILILAQRRGGSRIKISLDGNKPWRAWSISFLVFALAASAFYAKGIHLSGDEPHYLMIAQSLVEDGDFDLKNNLENKSYLAYLPVELRFHGTVNQGKYRSFHLPGVSFLLVPFFYLFNLLHGLIAGNLYFRLCAALINAFFALGLLKILKIALPEKDNSILFLFLLTTFPLVFQAIHLYPELPAATLLLFAYLNIRGQRRNFFLPGLLLAGIPWFHFKYAIPMLILAFFVMAGIWRRNGSQKEKARDTVYFLIPQAISASLLAFYSKIIYGSFDPTVISPEKHFFSIPLGLKIETLLSFFLDQRDGLLVYAPVFFMLFLVFKKEIRSQIRDFSLLAAIFLSYILFHAYTTVRGGYSPAARPLLFVFWIMAVFLAAYWRHSAEKAGHTLFRFLAGLTFFSTIWLFYYPLFLYQPVTRTISQRASGLLLFLSSSVINLAAPFPSFLKKSNTDYLPNWLWLAALAITIGLYYARVSWRAIARPARLIFPALSLLLMFSICFFPHVLLQTRYTSAGLSIYCNSKNFTFRKDMDGFKIMAGQDYDLFIDLKGSAADSLNFTLLNKEKASLKIKNGRQTLLAENQAPENRLALRLQMLKKFTLGKKTLVHLGIESSTLKDNAFFVLKIN